jgi:hypothetical protein
LAFQSSDTLFESFFVTIIKAAFVGFPAVLVPLALLMQNGLFVLDHKLSECFVDHGFILVVLIEDELGKFCVMQDEVPKRENDVMTGIVNRIFCSHEVLWLSVFSPVLDKLCEFLLYRISKLLLRQLVFSFDMHGGKL